MTNTSTRRAAIAAFRPHQWTKNLLVVVPYLASHRLLERGDATVAIVAFAAFSLTASAGYVFNDVVDLPCDRRHPTKAGRPFASSAIPVRWQPWLIAPPLALALVIALTLPSGFQITLASYAVLATIYTVRLKRIAGVDVLTLAALYTLRLVGGATAAGIVLPAWVLPCSMLLFTSLALVKRVTDLRVAATVRGVYRASDTHLLECVGVVSGMMAISMLAVQLAGSDVRSWWLCLLLLLWLSRMWLVTRRNEMHDDPVAFTLRDAGSYWIAAMSAVIYYAL